MSRKKKRSKQTDRMKKDYDIVEDRYECGGLVNRFEHLEIC